MSEMRYRLWVGGLLCLATALLFAGTASTPPTERKEVRVWEVVHWMVASGDWLVPRIDGAPHLTKPPLYFWLASAVSSLRGGETLLTFRLPSMLAALVLTALTVGWTRRYGSRELSIVAGATLLMMGRFLAWGRLGTFEMLLAALSAGALIVFYKALEEDRRSLVPPFFGLFALAVLTKGTAPLFTIAAPAAAWMVVRRKMGPFRSPLALLCLGGMLVVGLSWYLVLVWRVPEAREVFLNQALLPVVSETSAASASQHKERFDFYFAALFEITFPISVVLPLVVRRAWKSRAWRENPALRFAAVNVATVFVCFSLLPNKQGHYILPIFAPLAILTAESFIEGLKNADWFTVRYLRGAAAFWGGAIALSVAYPVFMGAVVFRWPVATIVFMSALLAAASAGLIHAAARGRWRLAAASAVAGTWALYLIVFGSYMTWENQFEASTVVSRSDYNSQQWERNFKQYPWLKKVFHAHPSHTFPPQEHLSNSGPADPE